MFLSLFSFLHEFQYHTVQCLLIVTYPMLIAFYIPLPVIVTIHHMLLFICHCVLTILFLLILVHFLSIFVDFCSFFNFCWFFASSDPSILFLWISFTVVPCHVLYKVIFCVVFFPFSTHFFPFSLASPLSFLFSLLSVSCLPSFFLFPLQLTKDLPESSPLVGMKIYVAVVLCVFPWWHRWYLEG